MPHAPLRSRTPSRCTRGRWALLLVLLVVALPASPAPTRAATALQANATFGVLFRDHEPLRLRIEADFHELQRDRDDENEERPGRLFIEGSADSATGYAIEIRTRGRFRLQSNVCRFPPLRLDLPRSEMDGTVFEGQDKLKLVTHCRDDDRYEQNTIKEYLVYRIYNTLTDRSFQARLARIVYIDSSGDDDPVERWGFVIESEEALAERLGSSVLEESPQGVPPGRIMAAEAARVDLFQYMVGNTDFSIYSSHNVVPFLPPGESVIPVPYDFDWTGLVDAPYAKPDPSLRLRNVRQRIFRGICRQPLDYSALYADFLARKDDITALVSEQPQLGESEREKVLKYLGDFWETLEDPRKASRSIEEACRPV